MKRLGVTATMVIMEFLDVVLYTITKAATNTGMSNYVDVSYSNALGFFFVLPTSLFYCSSSTQILKYVGIGLSSPTLATAMSNIAPAFSFILAVISRMEVLDLRMKSSQAKSIGSVISIAGALIVTLYRGFPLTSAISVPHKILNELVFSLQSKWVTGGFLLLLQSFSLALLYVVQAWVIRDFPAELMASLIRCLFVTIISTAVALAEISDPNAWKFKSKMELIALGYNIRIRKILKKKKKKTRS
nr:WAT1-related protein At5g40240-like isoform X1 [Ziziphus jujuba var. spinosa]